MATNQQASSSSPPPAKRIKKYLVGTVEGREKCYLNAMGADVHFIFESSPSGTRVPAHKIILARDSDVFKQMFYGELKETGDIHITDASAAAFKEFLQFFYLTDVELTVENFADVMRLGDKYNVVNCADVCVRFFKDEHNADNILIGLSMGLLYSHSELIAFCERYIARNTNAIMQSNGFLECDRKMLEHILNANLFVCSEVRLFRACMKWVKAKSVRDTLSKDIVDKHLGESFYRFRFGAMTIEQFCQLHDEYPTVLSNDYIAITKQIVRPYVQQNKFNIQSRQIKWTIPEGAVVKCDREIGSLFEAWVEAEQTERIPFTVDQPILLTGFTCNKAKLRSTFDNAVYVSLEVDVEICCIGIPLISKFTAELSLQNSIKISLSRPILVCATYYYTISITFRNSFLKIPQYNSKELTHQVQLESGTVVKFDNCTKTDDGSKVVSIISALEFNRV